MYTSYETTLDTLHAFASELSNKLQWGTRFYEGLEMFEIKPIVDGLVTYSVIGYDVEQAILVSESVSAPDIVSKYRPEEPDCSNDEAYEEWLSYVSENYIDTAFIGFHILPLSDEEEALIGLENMVKVVPYVDYKHVDSNAYAEGSPKFLTIEQITKEPARYVGTLELMLAQL